MPPPCERTLCIRLPVNFVYLSTNAFIVHPPCLTSISCMYSDLQCTLGLTLCNLRLRVTSICNGRVVALNGHIERSKMCQSCQAGESVRGDECTKSGRRQ